MISRSLQEKVGIADLLIVLAFFAFSIMYFLGVWKGASPYVFLSGDIAAGANIVAANMFPELFASDALHGDLNQTRFYLVFQSLLIKLLYKYTGHFGDAVIYCLAPHIFVQLLGFYVFGRVVFGSRIWALFLTMLTARYVGFNLGEFWGLYPTMMPRVTYQAFLPFLLAAVVYWRNSFIARPILMFVAGLMFYLHPVSAPGIGFALLCGYWFYWSDRPGLIRQLVYLFLLGVVFLVGASPFVYNYLIFHSHGATQDYHTIFKILDFRYMSGYMDLPHGIKTFFRLMSYTIFYPVGILVGAILYFKSSEQDGAVIRLAAGWTVGLFVVSIIFPLIDHTIARQLKVIPLEVDLVRNLRFTILLAELFLVVGLFRYWKKSGEKLLVGIAVFALLFLPSSVLRAPAAPVLTTVVSWFGGGLVPELEPEAKAEISATIEIQRVVPEGEPVFVAHGVDPLAVRYASLRPVVYAYKDGGGFAYGNSSRLVEWYDQTIRLRRISEDHVDPLYELFELARDSGARYLVVGYDLTKEKHRNSRANQYMRKVLELRTPLSDGDTNVKSTVVFELAQSL